MNLWFSYKNIIIFAKIKRMVKTTDFSREIERLRAILNILATKKQKKK